MSSVGVHVLGTWEDVLGIDENDLIKSKNYLKNCFLSHISGELMDWYYNAKYQTFSEMVMSLKTFFFSMMSSKFELKICLRQSYDLTA